jgi:phosphoadenosine phosphosulfate reductase
VIALVGRSRSHNLTALVAEWRKRDELNSVRWDRDTGGVLFASAFPIGTADVVVGAPRPVFWEELDLLGLAKVWTYRHVPEPLLWAVDRRYYYHGDPVLDVRGGGMTTGPKLDFINTNRLRLLPVNVPAMLHRNSAVLDILENEAMEFVLRTYRRFRSHVDFTVVAFSGGKDSQVILDIVSKALHPDQYIVVFTDTTMELPCTLETVELVKEQYRDRFPALRFLTAQHETPALELWSKFGPPSRMHRWCCSVYMSAPVVRLLHAL